MTALLPEKVIQWIAEVMSLEEFRIEELRRHGSNALKGTTTRRRRDNMLASTAVLRRATRNGWRRSAANNVGVLLGMLLLTLSIT
jgi:hypothetical protein